MSKLPQIRRLLVEDFMDQKDWISKLFTPLNTFMESVASILSKGVSIKDNCTADIQTVSLNFVPTFDETIPVRWSLNTKPVAMFVGNVKRVDGADFLPTTAVAIQWTYDTITGLKLTDIVGITPSIIDQFTLTLVIFAG